MTNQIIDNSADEQLGNVILWQYDKAINLCTFIYELRTFFNATTKNIWDTMIAELNVGSATDFGLSILGTLIGCPRPDGISTDLYRDIIKAWFTLMMSNFSIPDINKYLRTIFGEGAICAYDGGDITYYPDRQYMVGDICEKDGTLYVCTTQINAPGEEWNPSHWNEIEEYSASGTYDTGDVCLYNGGLYRCTTPIETPEEWISGHWTEIRFVNGYSPMTLAWGIDDSDMSDEAKSLVENYPELVFNYPAGVFDGSTMEHRLFALVGQEVYDIEYYSSSSKYRLNEICVYGGEIYRCTTEITTAEAWNSSHWAKARQYSYSSSTMYYKGDIVILDNELYMCINDVHGGTPGPEYWKALRVRFIMQDSQKPSGIAESTDPPTGCLDNSNFIYGNDDETKYIPENERITS